MPEHLTLFKEQKKNKTAALPTNYLKHENDIKAYLVNRYSYEELGQIRINEYKRLYELVDYYISSRAIMQSGVIQEPLALSWFSLHFHYPYYDEYGQVFVTHCIQQLNQKLAKAKNLYLMRTDSLAKAIDSFSDDKKLAFGYLFDFAYTSPNASIPYYLKDYIKQVLKGNDWEKNQKYEDVKSKVTQTVAQYKTRKGYVLLNGSPLTHAVAKIKTYTSASNSDVRQHLTQYTTITDCISYGPIKGIKGMSGILYNGTPLYSKIASESEQPNKLFPHVFVTTNKGLSYQPASPTSTYPSQTVKVKRSVTKDNPVSQTIKYQNVDKYQVAIKCDGLYDHGRETSFQIRVKIRDKNGRTRTIATDTWRDYFRGEKIYNYYFSLQGNEEAPVTVTVERLDYSNPDDHEISKKTEFAFVNCYYEYLPTYPSMATVTTRFNSDTFNSEPKRNFHVLGRKVKIPSNYNPETRTYSGTWSGSFKTDYTNNPAWIIYDLLTDFDVGLGRQIPAGSVDKFSFYKAAKYCDEQVNGKPRYTINIRIDRKKEIKKIISQITDSINANLIDGDMLRLVMDRPSEAVYTFSNTNVLNGTFTRQGSSLKARYKRICCEFLDEENGFSKNKVIVEDVKNNSDYQNEKTLTLYGVTNAEQAKRYAAFALATQKYEIDTITFTSTIETSAVEVGDVVEICDYLTAEKACTGRIQDVVENPSGGLKVFLDDIDSYFYGRDDLKVVFTNNGTRYSNKEGASTQLFKENGKYYFLVNNSFNSETRSHNPIPEIGNNFVLYTEEIKPEEYKILSRNIDNDSHLLTYRAQRYSREKYRALSDNIANSEFAFSEAFPEAKTNIKRYPNAYNLDLSYTEENDKQKVIATWEDEGAEDFVYDIFCFYSAGGRENGLVTKKLNVEDRRVELIGNFDHEAEYIVKVYKKLKSGVVLGGGSVASTIIVDRLPFTPLDALLTSCDFIYDRSKQGDDKLTLTITWDTPDDPYAQDIAGYKVYFGNGLVSVNEDIIPSAAQVVDVAGAENKTLTHTLTVDDNARDSAYRSISRFGYLDIPVSIRPYTFSGANSHARGENRQSVVRLIITRISDGNFYLSTVNNKNVLVTTTQTDEIEEEGESLLNMQNSTINCYIRKWSYLRVKMNGTTLGMSSDYYAVSWLTRYNFGPSSPWLRRSSNNLSDLIESNSRNVEVAIEGYSVLGFKHEFIMHTPRANVSQVTEAELEVKQVNNSAMFNLRVPSDNFADEYTVDGKNIRTQHYNFFFEGREPLKKQLYPFFTVKELSAGTYSYAIERVNVYGFSQRYAGTLSVSSSAVSNSANLTVDPTPCNPETFIIRSSDQDVVEAQGEELVIQYNDQNHSYAEHFEANGWRSIHEQLTDRSQGEPLGFYSAYNSNKRTNRTEGRTFTLEIPVPVRHFNGNITLTFASASGGNNLSYSLATDNDSLRYREIVSSSSDGLSIQTSEPLAYSGTGNLILNIKVAGKENLNARMKLSQFKIEYQSRLNEELGVITTSDNGEAIVTTSTRFYNVIEATGTSNSNVLVSVLYNDQAVGQTQFKIETRDKNGEKVSATVSYKIRGY